MAKLKEAALAAAHEIAGLPTMESMRAPAVARIVEDHMRSLLEQATDVARLWAVVRGSEPHGWEAKCAAEDLARELRAVMEGA